MMVKQNILMAFLGDFNHTTTTSLLNNFKRKMNFLETATGINKKVYKVMVECLENISRHKASTLKDKKAPSDAAIFMLIEHEEQFCIMTGNYLKTESIEPLQQKLDKINSLDKTGLQEFYRTIISAPRSYTHNGAGLGLIDISLKTSSPLKYRFQKISEQYSFFTLEVNIKHR
ncbi:MAG: hypothetical protein A3K10_05380 [Bacteroidetes bacterium RIFCSPLOWO2_12_FULL_31_6]|nr:MAG: hypothetical protein A3K10_05380 [Bacteroidetes bacterium RIFCSPLOWO2_12_FULL_31_6]